MSYQYDVVVRPSSGLRLHLNENTAGCSSTVLDAFTSITRLDAAFYPDYDAAIAACAARLGVAPEQFILTNGLDEGILAVAVAALRDRTVQNPEAIVVMPAFDMYASTSDGVGARVVEVALDEDFVFSTSNVLDAIHERTRLLFLTNPNNPTGQLIPLDAILTIARAAPHVLIFLDEAYADFSGVTLLGHPEAASLSNLIIGRTFAKAYGIAGLRAGAVIGHAATIERLRRIVPPFSLNVCAAAAIAAGLGDTEHYAWYLAQVRESKELLYRALTRLGIRYWQSAANFVLIHLGANARRIVDGLAARQIYVRDKSRDPACPGCVRVTAGVVEHTEACIRALEEVMCAAGS
jgi:histidinol-phosphate aminotransferase